MSRSLRVLVWAIATIVLGYLLSRADRSQLQTALSGVDYGWVALAIVANTMILVSWAALWWVVSPKNERPDYGVMFEINAVASALMNTMPFLGGHAGAVVLMVRRGGLTRAGALSVLALDQLGEGLAKVAIFGVVALAAPIPAWMRLGIATVCSAVGALGIALVTLAHRHTQVRPRDFGPLTFTIRTRIIAANWAQRMEALRSIRLSFVALGFALGTKLAEGVGVFAVQHAFGVDLPASSTVLVLAAVVLGSILPVSPGNVGTYEAGAFIAYRHLGIEPGLATILAIASHICFMIPSIGVGYMLGSRRWMRVARGAAQSA